MFSRVIVGDWLFLWGTNYVVTDRHAPASSIPDLKLIPHHGGHLTSAERKGHKNGSKGGHDLKNLVGKYTNVPWVLLNYECILSVFEMDLVSQMVDVWSHEKSVGCPYLRTRLLARQNRIWRHFSGHLDFYMFRFWGSWPKPFFCNYYREGETTQHSQVGCFFVERCCTLDPEFERKYHRHPTPSLICWYKVTRFSALMNCHCMHWYPWRTQAGLLLLACECHCLDENVYRLRVSTVSQWLLLRPLRVTEMSYSLWN